MLKYVLKRILYFVPTLWIISLLTFWLSTITPGDPVMMALGNKENGGDVGLVSEKIAYEKAYIEKAEKMGLQLPVFYFSFSSLSKPDTLYTFVNKSERETLSGLIAQYGNWDDISNYYYAIKKMDLALYDVVLDSTNFIQLKELKQGINRLYLTDDADEINSILDKMNQLCLQNKNSSILNDRAINLKNAFSTIQKKATIYKNYIPSIKWYGCNNQYHRWLFGEASWFLKPIQPGQCKGFLRGDFGTSYIDGRPIDNKLVEAMPVTLTLSLISLFFSYLLSIPIGVFSAVNKGSLSDRSISIILFLLNSLPVFWIATLLVTFVTNEEYGMDWFPVYGLGDVSDTTSSIETFGIRLYHLTLPAFCMTYGGIAYLSRQMRGGMLSVLEQDFIRTARAKGSSNNMVIWKHAFKNSLIPVITILSTIFPAMITGSFIIEFIFSLQGMGKITLEALTSRDFPMIFTVMMLSAILTLIGNLISDIIYAKVDPRISFYK